MFKNRSDGEVQIQIQEAVAREEKKSKIYRLLFEETLNDIRKKWFSGEAKEIQEEVAQAKDNLLKLFIDLLHTPSICKFEQNKEFRVGSDSVKISSEENLGLFIEHGKRDGHGSPVIQDVRIDKTSITLPEFIDRNTTFIDCLLAGARTHVSQVRLAKKYGFSIGKCAYGNDIGNSKNIVLDIFNEIRYRNAEERKVLLPESFLRAFLIHPFGVNAHITDTLQHGLRTPNYPWEKMREDIKNIIDVRLMPRLDLIASIPHGQDVRLRDEIAITFSQKSYDQMPYYIFPVLAGNYSHIYLRFKEPSIKSIADAASDIAIAMGFTQKAETVKNGLDYFAIEEPGKKDLCMTLRG